MSDDMTMADTGIMIVDDVQEISKNKYDVARRSKEKHIDDVGATFVTQERLAPPEEYVSELTSDLCIWFTDNGRYYRGNMWSSDWAGKIRTHKLRVIKLQAIFDKVANEPTQTK